MRLNAILGELERIRQVLFFVLKDRSGMVDFGAFFPAKESEKVFDTSIRASKGKGAYLIKGCKVTLNFLPESNGKTIDTVKKMLVSSQCRDIPGSGSNG